MQVLVDIDAAIQEAVATAHSIEEVRDGVISLFTCLRSEHPDKQIRYAIGIITSDGPEHEARNMKRLKALTEYIREREDGFVFSATSIWNDDVFVRINAPALSKQAWLQFWRDILRSGFIPAIFLTKRWEFSSGARDEYQTAVALGLQIIDKYVELDL